MSIIVDDLPLEHELLGMASVGEIIEHVRSKDNNRLIVQVLIDGATPQLSAQWNEHLGGRTMFVETADRRQLAIEALAEAQRILDTSDADRQQTIDDLSANQSQRAMAPMGNWLAAWQQVPKAVMQSAQAVGLDTQAFEKGLLPHLIADLTSQLRQIQTALESKDFVTLGDILNYEAPTTVDQWQNALKIVRHAIQ